jgi:hypothetical protein
MPTLNPAKFNRLLNKIGQDFLYRKAYACPCVSPTSGAANAICQICFGKGRYWLAPVPAVAGVASQKVQIAWAQFGLYEKGDTLLSIPSDSPMYSMGQFDRALALNGISQFSQVYTRGSEDRLNFTPVKIDRVFWLNSDLTATIDGTIPAVDASGNMTWVSGGPPTGTIYTVSGSRYDEFYCFMDDPNNRMEQHGSQLPRRVVMRAFDLFGR